MNPITNQESRQLLLQRLRKLVCFTTSLWDTCADVDSILGGEFDSLAAVMNIAAAYADKDLVEDDLRTILVEMKLPISASQDGKTEAVENLERETLRTLLRAFQNAIAKHSEICVCLGALAKTLNCSIEHVEKAVRSIAVVADTGLEVAEPELCELLGEYGSKGCIRVGKPLKDMLLN